MLLLSQVTDIVDEFPQGKDSMIRSIHFFGILTEFFQASPTCTQNFTHGLIQKNALKTEFFNDIFAARGKTLVNCSAKSERMNRELHTNERMNSSMNENVSEFCFSCCCSACSFFGVLFTFWLWLVSQFFFFSFSFQSSLEVESNIANCAMTRITNRNLMTIRRPTRTTIKCWYKV